MRLSTKFFTTSKSLLSVPRVKITLLRKPKEGKVLLSFFWAGSAHNPWGHPRSAQRYRDASFRWGKETTYCVMGKGRKEGRKGRREEGREEGRKEGRKGGGKERRKGGREGGREEGRGEGRKVGREEGRKGGKEGGREHWAHSGTMLLVYILSFNPLNSSFCFILLPSTAQSIPDTLYSS